MNDGKEGMVQGVVREGGWMCITELRQMGWKLCGATDRRGREKRREICASLFIPPSQQHTALLSPPPTWQGGPPTLGLFPPPSSPRLLLFFVHAAYILIWSLTHDFATRKHENSVTATPRLGDTGRTAEMRGLRDPVPTSSSSDQNYRGHASLCECVRVKGLVRVSVRRTDGAVRSERE